MAEMPAAAAAADFGAVHHQRLVVERFDGRVIDWLVNARQASAAFELGLGVEQLLAASGADVDAVFVVVPVLSGERTLGAGFAEDVVRLGVELFLPLGVGLLERVLACRGGLVRSRRRARGEEE